MASSADSLGLQRYLSSPSPSPSMITNQNYSINGKVVISALAILLFIVIVFFFLHILHAKQLQRRSALPSVVHGRLRQSLSSQDSLGFIPSPPNTPLTGGLDKEIVEVLPVFRYKSLGLLNATNASELAVECAVCLSSFRQDETCKLLPKCKHFFHTDCIDMWFFSNTTCPLCRAAITGCNSDCGEVLHAVGGSTTPCGFTKQDAANEPAEFYHRVVTPTPDTRDHIAYGYNSNGDWKRQGNPLFYCQFSIQSPTTSWSYKRYKIEKVYHTSRDGAQLLMNVSPRGNHMQMPMRMNPMHWKTGRRSFSHTTIDTLRPQESLIVGVSSCPALVVLGSPEPCSTSLPHLVHHLGGNWSC